MRYLIELAYDGRSFSGWQKQPGTKTVQGELERALSVLEGHDVQTTGAGRTDAGVHARGQAVSFDLEKKWEPGRLRLAIENNLPPEMGVNRVSQVAGNFSARYDAIWREYAYFLWKADSCYPHIRPFVWRVRGDWNSAEVAKACRAIEGTHDFALFCPLGERPPNTTRTALVSRLLCRKNAAVFRIRANCFLYHMVRYLVGDLNRIAQGRMSVEEFLDELSGKGAKMERSIAPASGLFLWRIGYAPSPWE
mgnify:CR=1 FL=1